MSMDTPAKAATRLSHLLDFASQAGHFQRFPVNVEQLALDIAGQFRFKDPVLTVQAVDLKTFEAGLFRVDDGWALLYSERIRSTGRVRFSQAHELGHYLLHREKQESFECSEKDMVAWGSPEQQIEAQADEFASSLLMPLNHLRQRIDETRVDFRMIGECADVFGVSLTAAALRWVSATLESAVLILSRDGFVDWAVSSDRARKNGAFFRTRGRVNELPAGSLAADSCRVTEKAGCTVGARTWFVIVRSKPLLTA
ncbi:ImmA/IrrE family metallo-endopeptidase [Variovorax sp. J22G73]|uniref:ImmA/IrrE family metallo-endopeptidase n=1 Tax=unclassified Variovorax TaxID=663243 RepID=UPI002576BBB9|nr:MULTISPECIES: ImmA/IrrE family metallo-endopeptidase [unclassified Variovorax]MDM0010635.1 ImmA/IrrE family metallo-endopeptidase [Variovorax sp. J22R203]MDM0103037.1 ImmA/IrrE family metallo-endopeptidase [Variovorax sp. J22G73]